MSLTIETLCENARRMRKESHHVAWAASYVGIRARSLGSPAPHALAAHPTPNHRMSPPFTEDDIAEDRTRDPEERSGARGARMALQNLSTRLLAAAALP